MNKREGYGLGAKIIMGIILMTLTGCSSFKLGGFCYIPAATTGTCSVGTNTPSQATVERMRQ